MSSVVDRPQSAGMPAGLLGFEKFQTAYVTNDLDRAVDSFRSLHNIQNWTIFDAGSMRVALAWTNGNQIEIIDTADEYFPLYDDWIDKHGDFALRFHHFGYFVQNDAEWDHLKALLAASGRDLPLETETETLKVIYAAAPELGHFLEFIYPNTHGKAFFESVAAN